jgi:hypothetical protein
MSVSIDASTARASASSWMIAPTSKKIKGKIKGDATLKVKIKWWIQHLTAPLERIFT